MKHSDLKVSFLARLEGRESVYSQEQGIPVCWGGKRFCLVRKPDCWILYYHPTGQQLNKLYGLGSNPIATCIEYFKHFGEQFSDPPDETLTKLNDPTDTEQWCLARLL